MKKLLFFLLVIVAFTAFLNAKVSTNYLVRTFIDKNGKSIYEYQVPGYPPEHLMPAVNVPENSKSVVTISNVPAFDWCYGCSATSAAMMAGHYDNTIFPNMYTGPTNSGVVPMNNSTWGSGECPLSATHQGYDGLGARGHVDDYWYSNNSTTDPYYGNWAQHGYADCTGDYMGTNQYHNWQNKDGATTFYYYNDGSPLYDYSGSEGGSPPTRDGCHGLRLFFESRGYNVASNYSQYIIEQGNTYGFTYAQYKAEIDAGRPVLIQLDGHTMLGYGYDDTSSNIVYIHDTWDYNNHTMTWAGSYGGMNHIGVTVMVLTNPSITITAPNGGESWNLGSTHNITWTSNYVTNVDIRLYNSGSFVGTIASNISAASGSYSWTIPTGLATGSTYSIKLSDSDAPSDYDDSDAYFTLAPQPTITVTSPNGGENWVKGSQFPINWTSTNIGPNVTIDLYSSNVYYKTIIASTPDNGTYNWDIPTNYAAGPQYTIHIEDAGDASIFDDSDSFFTLSNAPGCGSDDNTSSPANPVTVDVEQIDIDGNTVDPNVNIDPTGSLALQVEVTVSANEQQHSVDNPGSVLISYVTDITGNISSNSLAYDLEYSGLAYNPPHPAYIYWWDDATNQWQPVSSPQWDTPTSEHVSFNLTLQNSKNGSTEIIMANDNPLPVTLSSFTSEYMNGKAVLQWITMSETNSNYWNVYKAMSENYAQATQINSQPIEATNNSTEATHYTYTDDTELENNSTYYYWIENMSYSGNSLLFGPVKVIVENNNNPDAPNVTTYGLQQNYPNPFNPTTEIRFTLKTGAKTYLEIYNLKGEKIVTLINGQYIEKDNTVTKVWNGTDKNGKNISNGIYLYKLSAGKYSSIKRMILLK